MASNGSRNGNTIEIYGYNGPGGATVIPATISNLPVTSIGTYAFRETSLTSVTIPDSVTNLGDQAFAQCTSLTSAVIPGSIANWGDLAFGYCYSLTNVTMSSSISSIGSAAFLECSSLSQVTIPASVTTIGPNAFEACTNLSGVIIPDSVTSIGYWAFEGCTSLTNIIIPDSVTNVGYEAFGACTSLSCVIIPDTITSIEYQTFDGCLNLTSVVIPDSVTYIGVNAFSDTGLTNVTIGEGVTNIDEGAFEGTELTGLTIPDSVTSIGEESFAICNLTNVTIPGSVTNIGALAFWACYSLTHVCFEGDAPNDGASSYEDSIFSEDPVSTVYYINGSTGWGPTFSYVNTAPCASCGPASIIPYRVCFQQANVSPTDGIDAPIIPVTDTNVLGGATNALGSGVVADGVTPVLFNITGIAGSYTIAISNNSANFNPSFSTNLFVLQNGTWANSTNLAILSDTNSDVGTNYAYLQGIDWTSLLGASSSNDVPITISLFPVGSDTPVASASFRIRPPPMMLVHGYNSDSSTWSQPFINTLQQNIPSDFIQTINYGVSYKVFTNFNDINGVYYTTNLDDSANRDDSFLELAPLLENSLETAIQGIQGQWACTRYDVVGHSQGGVLTRMLCQVDASGKPVFASRAPVSTNDFYRGRFRRVITLGSPHNGTTLLRYWLDEKLNGFWAPNFWGIGDLIVPKFDPFECQIELINNPAIPVDSRIKFCCMEFTIGNEVPPGLGNCAPVFFATGLCRVQPGTGGASRGSFIIPQGSDGIVDFNSQGAGLAPANKLELTPYANVAHCGPFLGFWVSPGYTETALAAVADQVNYLLTNGAPLAFGPFVLPTLLPSTEASAIDALVPDLKVAPVVYPLENESANSTANPRPSGELSTVSGCFDYVVQPPANEPIGDEVAWYAQLYTTNGIISCYPDSTTNGISLAVSGTNDTMATICVDSNVTGTVVLMASYSATNGDLVLSTPVVVATNPQGQLSNIFLMPGSPIEAIGDSTAFQVWGSYNVGAPAQLFIAPGANAVWSSSNTNVYTVDTNGVGSAITNGTATVSFSYLGNTAQANVTVQPPGAVVIVTQPQSQQLTNGQTVVLSVNAAGTPPFSYQWYFDGYALYGATNATYTIDSFDQYNDDGLYYAVVSNALGTSTSAVANLVVSIPAIFANPQNQTVLQGAKASFTALALGAQPLYCQWIQNGTNVLSDNGHISGSATTNLVIYSTLPSDAGRYSAVFSNSFGQAFSAPATLTVIPAPVLYSFTDGATAADGEYPTGGLIQGADGNLYGTTAYGGSYNAGTLFSITTNGIYNTIAVIYSPAGSGSSASLLQAPDGILLGSLQFGGPYNSGATFGIGTNGVLAAYQAFTGANGADCYSALIFGPDGSVYGTTRFGGIYGATNGDGTIFKITTNGLLISLHFFDMTNGANPYGGLVYASDGNFYGVSTLGGNGVSSGGYGTLFRLGTNGSFTNLYSFHGLDGAYPGATLIQGTDGALYETTYAGGTYDVANGGAGTVFRITTNGNFSSLFSFNVTNGANPLAELLQLPNGSFYGVTSYGAISNMGTLFSLSPAGVLTNLVVFTGTNGANPTGALIEANDGALYGTTVLGGLNNYGTVFRYPLTAPIGIILSASIQPGGNILLSWNSVGGQSYAVQYRTNLTLGSWNNLTNVTATGTISTATDSTGPDQERFYRILP